MPEQEYKKIKLVGADECDFMYKKYRKGKEESVKKEVADLALALDGGTLFEEVAGTTEVKKKMSFGSKSSKSKADNTDSDSEE